MIDWETEARKLPCGSKKRVRCCGDDKSMLVTHDLKGFHGYCFRCRVPKFIPHGTQSIQEIHQRQTEYQESKMLVDNHLHLPEDFTADIPTQAMFWFLKYGISYEKARDYGFGYTPSLARVVMPVYDDNELCALQMRAIRDGVKPKYLNPEGPRTAAVLFEANKSDMKAGELLVECIITEDILSAIKCGEAFGRAYSMLGTVLTDARANTIARHNYRAYVWTDNDEGGYRGADKAIRQLILRGVETYRVHSERDPKTYTREEIMNHIKGATRC